MIYMNIIFSRRLIFWYFGILIFVNDINNKIETEINILAQINDG
tara:strand:+ start:912 stop:1043 length:132 start_codon:yes stop_codon:yes gene_type:complete